MGFVNINGNQVHTSNIGTSNITVGKWSSGVTGSSGTSGTISISGHTASYISYSIQPQKTTYHILGEDFEIEGWQNEWVAIHLSHLNTYAKLGLAKVYYEELKKNKIRFEDNIDEIIQKRLLIVERDRKINSIIDEK